MRGSVGDNFRVDGSATVGDRGKVCCAQVSAKAVELYCCLDACRGIVFFTEADMERVGTARVCSFFVSSSSDIRERQDSACRGPACIAHVKRGVDDPCPFVERSMCRGLW